LTYVRSYLREIITMAKLDNQSIQLLLFAAVALALVFQTIVVFALLLVMRKTAKTLTAQLEEMRASVRPIVENVIPIVENTRELLARVTPKIVETSVDVAALTKSLRLQTADVQSAAAEIMARVRTQSGRIDTLLSNTLDSLERATGFMTETLTKPMRQIGALLASAKAVVESLRASDHAPRSPRNQSSSDNDLFV
jgi:hypothetical protein